MRIERLRELIGAGENAHVEFKSVFKEPFERFFPDICAFLNCGGGYLVFGVSEMERGLIISDESKFNLKNIGLFEQRLQSAIAPKAPIFVNKVSVEKRYALVVTIPSGKNPPYACSHVIYKRVGERTLPADMSDVKEWVLRSQEGLSRWENRFALPSIEECVSSQDVIKTISDIRQSGRLDFKEGIAPEVVLDRLGLARYGRILNAGVIVSGKRPGKWMPQARIRIACYAYDKSDAEVPDAAIYDQPLCMSIDDVVEFVHRNSANTYRFNPKNNRRETLFAYPPMAVREALVNACAHREYESSFGGISVSLFPDRLEIWNSGKLPDGIDMSELNRGVGQPSVLRNPTIANALYLRGYMEQLGRGSVLMPRECLKFGLPLPEWSSSESGGVKVTFRRRQTAVKAGNSVFVMNTSQGLVNGPVFGQVNGPANGPVTDSSNNLVNGLEVDFANRSVDNFAHVLTVIGKKPGLRQNALARLVNISERKMKRIIETLRKNRLIEFRGAPKNGGYFILSNGMK